MLDQGEERTAVYRWLTPKTVTFIFGIYVAHYYFKYNLGVSVRLLIILLVEIYATYYQMNIIL